MTIKQIQIAAPAKKAPAKKAPAKKAAPKKDEKPKLGKGANEPTAYFESLERNRKGSMKVMKKQWSKAVKLAEAEGKGKKGPYIMRIFKNLMGISTATADAGGLPGIGNEPTGVDTVAPPGGPTGNITYFTKDDARQAAKRATEHPFDVAGLTETAALSDWKVLFSYKDPSGKGIATGTQTRKSASADGAKKGATLWAKRTGKEGFSVTRVTKASAAPSKDDNAPFDYERWKNSGKPRKPEPSDGKLAVKPRKPVEFKVPPLKKQ